MKMDEAYDDLAKLIAEIKEIHKQYLPPLRIGKGYEIVGILQDMALEDESEALKKWFQYYKYL